MMKIFFEWKGTAIIQGFEMGLHQNKHVSKCGHYILRILVHGNAGSVQHNIP